MRAKNYKDLCKLRGDKLLKKHRYTLAIRAYLMGGKELNWIGKKIGDFSLEEGSFHTAAKYYMLGGNMKELIKLRYHLAYEKNWNLDDGLVALLTVVISL